MANCAEIVLKSGDNIMIEYFQCINLLDEESSQTVIIKEFKNFYLDDKFITFIGKNTVVSLNSSSIDYVLFTGKFFE